jgi:NTP pyrophosphatase (non-canonical NTP hydrolase)
VKLNLIAAKHHQWVEQMNWHNRTHLEAAGMIASEVSEACDEITHTGVTPRFAEEIADVVLRCMDEGLEQGMDIDASLALYPVDLPAYESLERSLIRLTAAQGPLINAARKGDNVAMHCSLAIIIQQCLALDVRLSLNLEHTIAAKMAKNLSAGNKGRLI